MDNHKKESMKFTERQLIQAEVVKGLRVGTRTTVIWTECTKAGAGVEGEEEQFLAEKATCDYLDNEISSE